MLFPTQEYIVRGRLVASVKCAEEGDGSPVWGPWEDSFSVEAGNPPFFLWSGTLTRDLLDRLTLTFDDLLAPLAAYVVDIELESGKTRTLLRIFVDLNQGSITVDTCSKASRLIAAYIEEQGLFGGKFALEVSSPGIERRVARPRDFQRFVGHEAVVKVRDPIDSRRNIKGVIEAASNTSVTLAVGDEKLSIPYKNVARANLIYDFSKKGGEHGV